MGTLRTLFALAVVLAHPTGGFEFSVGARGAVQLFYVISGFLISYVLTEARSYRTGRRLRCVVPKDITVARIAASGNSISLKQEQAG